MTRDVLPLMTRDVLPLMTRDVLPLMTRDALPLMMTCDGLLLMYNLRKAGKLRLDNGWKI